MKTGVFYVTNFSDFKLLKMSIYTLRKYYKDDVYVLTDFKLLTTEYSNFLVKNNVVCIDCEDMFRHIFTNEQIYNISQTKFTLYTMYRLLFPFIEQFYQYESMLYLDTDTIIMLDISKIFNIKIKYGYALIKDESHGKHSYKKFIINQYNNLYLFETDIFMPSSYDNAGVILFNYLNICSNINYYKQKIYRLNTIYDSSMFKLHDLCILNLFFKHDLINDNNGMSYNTPFIKNAIIYHYRGSNKSKLLLNAKKDFYYLYKTKPDWSEY